MELTPIRDKGTWSWATPSRARGARTFFVIGLVELPLVMSQSVLEGGCAAAKDFVLIELFGGDSRGGG